MCLNHLSIGSLFKYFNNSFNRSIVWRHTSGWLRSSPIRGPALWFSLILVRRSSRSSFLPLVGCRPTVANSSRVAFRRRDRPNRARRTVLDQYSQPLKDSRCWPSFEKVCVDAEKLVIEQCLRGVTSHGKARRAVNNLNRHLATRPMHAEAPLAGLPLISILEQDKSYC